MIRPFSTVLTRREVKECFRRTEAGVLFAVHENRDHEASGGEIGDQVGCQMDSYGGLELIHFEDISVDDGELHADTNSSSYKPTVEMQAINADTALTNLTFAPRVKIFHAKNI